MDFNKIIARVLDLITKPVDTMQVIKNEPATIKDLYLNYAIILAAVPSVASLIGYLIMGFPIRFGLVMAITTYVMALVGVGVVALVIDLLAPSFGVQKDLVASFKVAVYTMTPAWVAGVIMILPRLYIIATLAGLYGIYLAYLGLIHIKQTAQDKVVGYLVVTIVASGIVLWGAHAIAMRVAFGNAYALASLVTY